MQYVSTETGSPTSDAPRARDGMDCLLRVCAISLAVCASIPSRAHAQAATPLDRRLAMRITLISALALAASSGCADSETSTREAELRSAIATFRTALNSGDSASFFGLLAADLEVLAPGAHPVRGPEARESFRPLFTQVKADIGPFTNEEITLSGDIAIQRHSYQLSTTPKSGGPVTTVIGSGLHIWKRMPDGRWQIVKDIWTNPPTS